MALNSATLDSIQKSLELSTDDFAGLIGMNPVTIKGWKNGNNPKLPTVVLLETIDAKLKKHTDLPKLSTNLKKTKKEKRLRWLVNQLCP